MGKFEVGVLVDYRESIKNCFHLEDLVLESYRRPGNLFHNWGLPDNPVELVYMHTHYISRSIQTRDLLEKILRLDLSQSANPTGICASL